MPHHAKKGIWEGPQGDRIVVVEDGRLPDGAHGPWVKYHILGADPKLASSVLWYVFNQLVDEHGYRFVGEKETE